MLKMASIVSSLAALAASVTGSAAFAGDHLLFKSGSVDSRSEASNLASRLAPAGVSYYVVQFKSTILEQDRKALQAAGAKIVRYVPDDALIVRVQGQAVAAIQAPNARVQAVLPMEGRWKTAQEFAPSSVFSRSLREEVAVRMFPGADEVGTRNAIAAMPGAQIVTDAGRSLVVRVTRPQVDEIAQLESVEWVQPNPVLVPLHMKGLAADGDVAATTDGDYTDLNGYESGTKVMKFDAAWARGFTGKGQIASMADTGLDNGTPATIIQDFTGRIPTGFIFGLFSKSWEDPMGHGTHVAGSIAGTGKASGGILRGGAYEAQFIPESMWSPVLSGLSVPSKLSDLFAKAYGAGARVHSNSWGAAANFGAYDSLAQQVDEYCAANPDMMILFAAGNSGVDADKDGRVDPNSIGSPGTAKNILTVGASKNLVTKGGYQMKLSETRLKESWPTEPLASSRMSENENGMAAFSSRGPTADGRLKPEIVAPGTNILSTRSTNPTAEPLWGAYSKDYVWSGGTSMATPLTAGAATVVRQYLIEDRKIAQPSAALLKAVMMHTAFDIYPGQFGEVGKARGQELVARRPNVDEGYGRVDVDKATSLSSTTLVDERTGLAAGETKSYQFNALTAGKLVATLVYTDAAGASSAAKALVNDLDLVVVGANGAEITLNDHVNNNEMIQTDVAAGRYEIRVKGTNVPQGPASGRQPFALVISVQ